MPKIKDQRRLIAAEKFWERLSAALEEWLPELAGIGQWCEWLVPGEGPEVVAERQRVEASMWNWKREPKNGGPRARPSSLARLENVLARLHERGADVRAVSAWVYSGGGDLPRRSGGSVVESVSQPVPFAQPVIMGGSGPVHELGRVAKELALEAAMTGEKIPTKYQRLVKLALEVRELAIRSDGRRGRGSRWTKRTAGAHAPLIQEAA